MQGSRTLRYFSSQRVTACVMSTSVGVFISGWIILIEKTQVKRASMKRESNVHLSAVAKYAKSLSSPAWSRDGGTQLLWRHFGTYCVNDSRSAVRYNDMFQRDDVLLRTRALISQALHHEVSPYRFVILRPGRVLQYKLASLMRNQCTFISFWKYILMNGF